MSQKTPDDNFEIIGETEICRKFSELIEYAKIFKVFEK